MSGRVSREFRIGNETKYLASVREAVRDVVTEASFAAAELNKLTLAVDEAVTNVMEHAYEYDLEGELSIEVALEATDSEFIARIRDWGQVFDPTQVPSPNLSDHAKEGRRHGLGIFLIKQVMDEISYTSSPGGPNELRLVRRVGQSSGGAARGRERAGRARPAEV
jgi:serine/threonine-protein kinase RsbW